MAEQVTILCISSYFKGNDFIRAAKEAGFTVLLLTEEKLKDKAWAYDSIDESFYMKGMETAQWVINTVSWIARTHKIDRLIPLDEFDLETAALLREHLLLDGMGYTATRPFRDKLTMRTIAKQAGINVPAFSPVFNYAELRAYTDKVEAPWVLKPRWSAGAIGIKKIHQPDELWHWMEELGDEASERVLEQFVPGDVYHVDSITVDGKVIFASYQQYGHPPMNVAHEGGVFTSMNIPATHPDTKALQAINEKVVLTLGMVNGVTHAEYIKAHADGAFYFLEIAARVGGAHLADLVEAGTGVNLWAEWARLEYARAAGKKYKLPKLNKRAAGLLVSLAKQEYPDTSAYTESEIVWRLTDKTFHAGLIVAAPKPERVKELIDQYTERFAYDFLAIAPPKDKPTD